MTQFINLTFYIQLLSDTFGLHAPHRDQSRNDLVLVWGIRKFSTWLEVLTHVSRHFAFLWDVPSSRMWNRSTKLHGVTHQKKQFSCNVFLLSYIKPLNPELNPICYLLALLGAHHFLHVSRIRVRSLILRLLMSCIYIYIYIYIYGAPILNVSRSHTTTHHSR